MVFSKHIFRKFWIPGVTGALLVAGAVIGVLIYMLKRSGKVDKVETDQQIKEPEDDPCETMLKEYLKAAESGMGKAKLKKLYAKGNVKCPKEFTLLEEPKVEDIRARLAQKQEEKKNSAIKASKDKKGNVSSGDIEESQTIGSKGKNNVSSVGKPVTVSKAKSGTAKITNKTVKASKDEIEDKTPTRVPGATGTKSKPDDKSDTTPKGKRAKAWQDCMNMVKEIEDSGAKDLIGGFPSFERNRIKKFANEGLLPKDYDATTLIKDVLESRILKNAIAGNDKEAQKAYNALPKQSRRVEDVTQKDDYKFLKAIANNDLNEATQLLDGCLFLPPFIREALKANTKKLNILKNISDSQMDALLEYCRWNFERDDDFFDYKYLKDEWKMADKKADYYKVVEKMRLLNEDIHKDFDFAIPELEEKKSCMQELDEYIKDKEKLPGFEDAYKKLREDKNVDIAFVLDAVDKLSKF